MTTVAIKIDWASLSGTILEGGYELKDVLEGRDNAAKLRVRILGSGGKTGTAYFMHLEPPDAEDQLDIWQTLRDAPHPNLNRPATLGKRDVAGVDVIYMVLPDADEKLAAVVPERPLEWEEAAEVLQSCEKGLAHLHSHGLLHGSVSPQMVEAVGYSVHLNTESVYRIGKTPRILWNKPEYLAPESKSLNLTTAADVWCLGATLFEVLSQDRYGTPGAELEKGLPLAPVVLRCLDKNPLTRCTLKDAATAQNVATSTAQAQAPPAEPPPAAPPRPTPEAKSKVPAQPVESLLPPIPPRPATPPPQSASSQRGSRLPQPLTPKEAPKQVTKEDMALVPVGKRHKKVQRQPVGARIRTLDAPDQEDPTIGESESTAVGPSVSARITALGSQSNLVRNIVAGVALAAMLVAAVWFIIIPKLKSIDQPLTSAIVPQQQPPVDSSVTPSSLDSPPIPAVAATSQAAAAPPPPPKPRGYFRVVVADFAGRADAEHERDILFQQHPELILQIGRMKTEKSGDLRFVVSVGGVLDASDAEPLLVRMQAKGLTTARLERIER